MATTRRATVVHVPRRHREDKFILTHFCADKDYDTPAIRRTLARWGNEVHIGHRRHRGEPIIGPVIRAPRPTLGRAAYQFLGQSVSGAQAPVGEETQ